MFVMSLVSYPTDDGVELPCLVTGLLIIVLGRHKFSDTDTMLIDEAK